MAALRHTPVMNDVAVSKFLESLGGLPGAASAAPAPLREVDRVEAFIGSRLPSMHRALLLQANGVTSSWGYERLFGVGDGSQDIGPWNARETWKFAWPAQLDDYLAFGQTGWGDQYAYRLSDLRRGIDTVYLLDRVLMEAADPPAAGAFDQFLTAFLERARKPDERITEAMRQVGGLDPDQLAVFSPSPLLVGLERATQLMKMFARSAMIINGDLATQLVDPVNESRKIELMDVYLDDRGRARLRVKWVRGSADESDPPSPPPTLTDRLAQTGN
jgi:hypothetical protein